jgi:AcrR family transcriptional regulator
MHTRLKVKQSVPTWIWSKEDRTSHINLVAAEVMCQRGYAATSMSDIADAVGLTKAGMYHYIRAKEHLLFEIMNFEMDRLEEEVLSPARKVVDAEHRLRAILETHSRRIMEQGGAVTILLEEMSALTTLHQRAIRQRKRAYFDLVRSTLQDLVKEGKLRPVDPTVAAFSLLGMLLWTSRWYRRNAKLTPKQATDNLIDIAIGAVLKGHAAVPKPARQANGNRSGKARPASAGRRS